MFPMAAVCGNTYVIKPSERDPGATMLLMELAKEAGLPDGVCNVIHGQHDGKCLSLSPAPPPLLKPILPSPEHDQDTIMLLMELAKEAGLPAGVCNVIHGQHDGKCLPPPLPHLPFNSHYPLIRAWPRCNYVANGISQRSWFAWWCM